MPLSAGAARLHTIISGDDITLDDQIFALVGLKAHELADPVEVNEVLRELCPDAELRDSIVDKQTERFESELAKVGGPSFIRKLRDNFDAAITKRARDQGYNV